MPPLLADFSHARACKPFCENSLTLPSGLTHTVTHTRKGNNGHKRAGQEAQGFLPGFFLSALHDLLYEVPHGLGGFVLFLPGGVGVGAQGKAGFCMT